MIFLTRNGRIINACAFRCRRLNPARSHFDLKISKVMLKETIGTDLLETYLSLNSETWNKEIAGQYERHKTLQTLRLVCKRLKAVVDAKIIAARPDTDELHYLLKCNWELKQIRTITSILRGAEFAPQGDALNSLLDAVFLKFPLLERVSVVVWKSNFTEMPESIGKLTNLTSLELGCYEPIKIDSLAPLRHCSKLSRLDLNLNKEDTLKIPGLLSKLPSLQSLKLVSNAMSIPEDFYKSTQLKKMTIVLENVEEISDSIGQLMCLTDLTLAECNKLKSLPDAIGQLSSLIKLEIHYCDKITALPDTISNLQSLSHLKIGSCDGLLELPDTIAKLSSIKEIEIVNCYNIDIPFEISNMIPDFYWYNED